MFAGGVENQSGAKTQLVPRTKTQSVPFTTTAKFKPSIRNDEDNDIRC